MLGRVPARRNKKRGNMPDIRVKIKVFCVCGEELDSPLGQRLDYDRITVLPCECCKAEISAYLSEKRER